MNTLRQVEQDLSRVAAQVQLDLRSRRVAGSSRGCAASLVRIEHLLDQIGTSARALAATVPPGPPSDSETETEEEVQVDECEVEATASTTIGRKRDREDEDADQPQQNLPTRVDCTVVDEQEVQLQHTAQLYLKCANEGNSLSEWGDRKIIRNTISNLLNLSTRTIGETLRFLLRGGVPTDEVAACFCEATAKVPVVLEQHMMQKNASHTWLTSAADTIGQIVAFAQGKPDLPTALVDPRLTSAQVALLQVRDRDGSEYLFKMKELVLQVKSQQDLQDVSEAIIQLACYYMRDFILKARLEAIGAASPRSEEHWEIFSDCGRALGEWTRKACKTSPQPDMPTYISVFEKKLRAFAKENPRRVSPALKKASSRITTLVSKASEKRQTGSK